MQIGIDLGGTKTEIIALDTQGNTLYNRRTATPSEYREILDTLRDLIQQAEAGCQQRASIGVGTPGSLSRHSGLMRNSNTACLNGKALKKDLEQLLERPVRIANDANCFTLSEATDGAGKGSESVFGVIVGTGTGGGLVSNKQLIIGHNAIAGEWGHNPLPWPLPEELPGPTCYCGQNGCIETFLSGPAMAQDYLLATGEQLSAEQIVHHATSGDGPALKTLQRYEHRMARALASVINLFDPAVIVLGGGLSNIQRLYQNVPELWRDFVFSDQVNTQLVPPLHGDASGVRGAAWLWAPEEYSTTTR